MAFEVGIISFFEAAHRLEGSQFGPANNLHGHSYKVEAIFHGSELNEDGVLCDFAAVQRALKSVMRNLHYKTLNDLAELRQTNTTAEIMAKFIHTKIRELLHSTKEVETLTIRIWENDFGYASFSDRL